MAEFVAEGDIVTMDDGRRAIAFVPVRYSLMDAEPVVRCCQCRSWTEGVCRRTGRFMTAMDFCSRGVLLRRLDEHELVEVLKEASSCEKWEVRGCSK